MSKRSVSARRSLLYSTLIIALICIVIGVTARTASLSSALRLESQVTATHVHSFAFSKIAKATYTASPTALPTASPTPESLVYSEIVINASITQNANEVVAPSYNGNKYILVDISEQQMYAYEGDEIGRAHV